MPENITRTDTGSSDLPGAFPETPAAGLEDVKVNPRPATAGIGNPFQSKAGQSLPPQSEITSNRVIDGVTLDKESYEKSGGAPVLPNPITPESERDAGKLGMFGLPEQSKSMIPESSLPVAGGSGFATIQSAGAGSTTAQLAGQVPKEPRGGANIQSAGAGTTTAQLAGEVPKEPRGVPEVVQESQKEAHVNPEASANPEAVQEKSAMESELGKTVPEQPTTTESTIGGKATTIAGGAAATAGAAAAGTAAYVQSGKATEDAKASVPETVKDKLPESVKDKAGLNGAASNDSTTGPISNGSTTGPTLIAAAVPDQVQESIAEAHQSPEAASSATAVGEKSAVETELLKKIPADQSVGEPAPEVASTAATAESAPKPMMKSTEQPLMDTKPETSATAGPLTLPPEIAREAPMETRKETPKEAKPSAVATAASEHRIKPESRDISPMTRTDGGPSVTTGVGSSSTPQKSTASAAPSSPAASAKTNETDKKSKRRSGFFDKIKSLGHRHKKEEK